MGSLMKSLRKVTSLGKIKASKHTSDMLLFGGVVLGVAAGIKACKDTAKFSKKYKKFKKASKQLDKFKKDKKVVNPKTGKVVKFTKQMYQDGKKELCTQLAIDAAKTYGLSFAMGAGGLGLIFWSHNVLKKRNVALTAALGAVSQQFTDYRKRVVDQYGKEVDHQLLSGYKTFEKEIEEIDENGKSTMKKEKYKVMNDDKQTDYHFFISKDTSGLWVPGSIGNTMLRIKAVQGELNELNRLDKYIFANRMYEMLQMKFQSKDGDEISTTYGGSEIGWTYNNLTGNADLDANGHTRIDLNPQIVYRKIKDGEKLYYGNDFPNDMEDAMFDPEHWEKCILINPNYEGPIRDVLYRNKRA